jgi:hypothetical protein
MKLTTNLTLNYSIEAETFQSGRKFSRVWFAGQEADKKQPHIVRKRIEMRFDPLRRRGDVKKCETEIVYIKVILYRPSLAKALFCTDVACVCSFYFHFIIYLIYFS